MAMGGTVWSVVASTTLPCRAATGRTNSTSAATISLTESSSYCGRGKRAKARYSSVIASSVLTCSRMAVTSVAASAMSAPPRSLTRSPTISAFSSMAAIGLRTSWATLSESRPTVAIRSATSSSA